MSTTAVVFLGIVALGSLVQGAFLVVLGREGLRLARRVDVLQAQIGDAIGPAVHDLTRATAQLATASEISAEQARRLGRLTEVVADRLEGTRDVVEAELVPAAQRVAALVAAVQGVRAAVAFYRRRRQA
jgi:enoyl-CoA hydratase/carnithine racemase